MFLLQSLSAADGWALPVLLALASNVAKVTLLLLFAGLVSLVLRRGSSATRHWLWSAALAASLLLPTVGAVAPEWKVPGLPSWGLKPTPAPVVERPQATAPLAALAAKPQAPSTRTISRSPARSKGPERASAPPSAAVPVAAALEASPAPTGPLVAAQAPARRAIAWPAWPALALGVWVAGSVLILLRVLIGQLVLVRLARRARPIRGAAWTALAERAAEQAGIDRPFELLESERVGVPATFGVVRPTVLLPTAARHWPEERRRAVLVHELAHAARYDCFTQLMAQIACALYWFHPGVWWAERMMRVERERACDDRVLGGRMLASDYADHLIQVLREAREAGLPAFGAVAFARRSSLEGRLLALLDPLRDRRSPSRRLAWGAGVTGGVLLLALGGAQLGPASDASESPSHAATAEGSVDRHGIGRVAYPSEVMLAPDAQGDLESRWAWALNDLSGQERRGGMWIGYELNVRAGGDHGLLSDSEGIDLALLNGKAAGPTLKDVLAQKGSTPAHPQDGLALLFHVSRGGTVDRVRAQTFLLPAQMGSDPVYWLGLAEDGQSLNWLRQLASHVSGDPAQRGLINAISFHGDSEEVNAWLERLAKSDARETLRAEAAEGLSRHPTPASIRVLDELARRDRSVEVRKSAIEALGEVDNGVAAATLFDIARTHSEALDVRREAVEALGEISIPEEVADKLAQLYESAQDLASQAEALGDASDAPEATCEKHKEKAEMEADIAVDLQDEADSEAPEAPDAPEVETPEADAPPAEAPQPEDPAPSSEELQIQLQAVETLARLPEDVALPRLARLARNHSCSRVRREATETIGQYQSGKALEILDELAWGAQDVSVEREAVETIAQYPAAQSLPRILKVARSHSESRVRCQAVEAMGQQEPAQVLDALDHIVRDDGDMRVRVEAVDALANLPDKAGAHHLERIVKAKLPNRVRREALEALGRDDPEAALPVLEEILNRQQTP